MRRSPSSKPYGIFHLQHDVTFLGMKLSLKYFLSFKVTVDTEKPVVASFRMETLYTFA